MKCLMEQIKDINKEQQNQKERLDDLESVIASVALNTEYLTCFQEMSEEE